MEAQDLLRRASNCESERRIHDNHWRDIASYILPQAYDAFFDGISKRSAPYTDISVDSTALLALTRFSSVLESMNTPRNQIWHYLSIDDNEVLKDRESQLWLEETNKTLFRYRYAPEANFSSQVAECYLSFGAFGQGVLFVDEEPNGGIRYRSIPLGHISFDVNHQNVIDSAYRKIYMTVRAAYIKWGDLLGEKTKTLLKKNPEQVLEFWHCIVSREDYDIQRKDAKGKRFASYYVDPREKRIISEGGYNSFPYVIPRYMSLPGSVYAFGPGSIALQSIKTLNEQKKAVLKQGHRVVDPVYLLHDDGVLDGFSAKPGAMNYGAMSAEGRRLVDVLPTGNLSVGREMMQDERAVINDIFLVTIFQILVETPEMTATEVIERTREKAALLSPIMGKIQSDMLDPMIDRELDILSAQGKLSPMPDALRKAGGLIAIKYDSPLSRAQRAEEGAGTMRTIQWAAEIAAQTQNPAVFDHFNFDAILPALSDINAMPESYMNSMNTIMGLRDSRNQQAQQQQMIEAAPGMAAMMKAVQP